MPFQVSYIFQLKEKWTSQITTANSMPVLLIRGQYDIHLFSQPFLNNNNAITTCCRYLLGTKEYMHFIHIYTTVSLRTSSWPKIQRNKEVGLFTKLSKLDLKKSFGLMVRQEGIVVWEHDPLDKTGDKGKQNWLFWISNNIHIFVFLLTSKWSLYYWRTLLKISFRFQNPIYQLRTVFP